MNTTTSPAEIGTLFREQGYRHHPDTTSTVIKKTVYGNVVWFILSLTIGICLLTFGLYYGLHYASILSGFFFLGFPILYDRWRYPNRITVDKTNGQLELRSGLIFYQRLRLADIGGLEVDESILTSDTSPFKEGYRDFVYHIYLNVAGSKVKLIRMQFRTESSEPVRRAVNYLDGLLGISQST